MELACKGEDCMSTLVLDKRADLAGPGIGDYKELDRILPRGYRSLLSIVAPVRSPCCDRGHPMTCVLGASRWCRDNV